MSAPYDYHLRQVLSGISGDRSDSAAHHLAMVLMENSSPQMAGNEEEDAGIRATVAEVRRNLIPLLHALCDMAAVETDLSIVDSYIYLMTSLRMDDVSQLNQANMALLARMPQLLAALKRANSAEPSGYAAPEILSMLSSILNETSRELCWPFMAPTIPTVAEAIPRSEVGGVVAALLLSNLAGPQPQYLQQLRSCVPRIRSALSCAFSGLTFAERSWGPGPSTKALASLAECPGMANELIAHNLHPLVFDVLVYQDDQWPVKGFPEAYYVGAKGSAARFFRFLAADAGVERLLQLLPNLVDGLGAALAYCDAKAGTALERSTRSAILDTLHAILAADASAKRQPQACLVLREGGLGKANCAGTGGETGEDASGGEEAGDGPLQVLLGHREQLGLPEDSLPPRWLPVEEASAETLGEELCTAIDSAETIVLLCRSPALTSAARAIAQSWSLVDVLN